MKSMKKKNIGKTDRRKVEHFEHRYVHIMQNSKFQHTEMYNNSIATFFGIKVCIVRSNHTYSGNVNAEKTVEE